MKIVVKENKTSATNEQGQTVDLVVGAEDIRVHGFQVVDFIVEKLCLNVSSKEELIVMGETLEVGMIARKLEDKLKREVTLSEGLSKIESY